MITVVMHSYNSIAGISERSSKLFTINYFCVLPSLWIALFSSSVKGLPSPGETAALIIAEANTFTGVVMAVGKAQAIGFSRVRAIASPARLSSQSHISTL